MFFKKNIPHGLLVLTVIISILSGFIGGALTNDILGLTKNKNGEGKVQQKVTEKKVYVEESSIIKTVKKVSPSVVSIVITKDLPTYKQRSFNSGDIFNDPFFSFPFYEYERDSSGQVKKTPKKVGGGSGVIVSRDGLILTNKHVVSDTKADYTVILSDGTEFKGTVVGRDPLNDIAALQMKDKKGKKPTNLQAATLGDSAKLQIGQRVVAIGNALAEYNNTVTTGIISGKGRDIKAGSINSTESLINLLQTDTAINPGNSGGPLVNLDGEVVGINVAIASGAQGIGFAIPIDDVKTVITKIQKDGKIVRPFLGVRYMLLDEEKAQELKIDVKGGALLVGGKNQGEFAVVPGSPADKVGLKEKDVILEVDGKKITTKTPLQQMIGNKSPGDEISLKVWRGGKGMTLKAKLKEAK